MESPDLTLFLNASEEKIRSASRLGIVDGIQRLASLYNVLSFDKENLSLFYDLRSTEFLLPEEVKHEKASVLMSDLFNIDQLGVFRKPCLIELKPVNSRCQNRDLYKNLITPLKLKLGVFG